MNVMGIQEGFYCIRLKKQMVKGDPTTILLGTLTEKAMAIMALKQGGYSHATGSRCWP